MRTRGAVNKMRTDVKGQHLNIEKAESKTADVVKGNRRSLHPLQEAAGDKENLVGAGRLGQMALIKEKPSISITETKHKKLKVVKTDAKTSILQDLTCEAGPSKEYWEVIAERRRIALEEALKENQLLHERVALLEEENAQCKVVIEDTRALVETLTEMLNEEDGDESNESQTE